MNVMIFDTETIDIMHPFCYNVGYVIADEKGNILHKGDWICEEIWNNRELFSTAYYAEKRPIYEKALQDNLCFIHKYEYVCYEMLDIIKQYQVEYIFAYNSPFDIRVIDFNCKWFNQPNFLIVPTCDIRGYMHCFLADDNYRDFCKQNFLFTDSGAYSSTAENVYRYISGNIDFKEDHTALSDSIIEKEILFATVEKGAILGTNYLPLQTLGVPWKRQLTLKTDNEMFIFSYDTMRINKDRTEIILKG